MSNPAAESLTLSADADAGSADRIASIIRNWHDDNTDHPGAWLMCSHQPCNAVRREVRHEKTGETL